MSIKSDREVKFFLDVSTAICRQLISSPLGHLQWPSAHLVGFSFGGSLAAGPSLVVLGGLDGVCTREQLGQLALRIVRLFWVLGGLW